MDLGAFIELYYQGQQQVYEQTPVRGYLSSVQSDAHFGLGKHTRVDSLVVKWPDGKMQVLQNVKADQTIKVEQAKANTTYSWNKAGIADNTLFTDITSATGVQLTQTRK